MLAGVSGGGLYHDGRDRYRVAAAELGRALPVVLLSIVFIARCDDFNIPHSPKRQRGDGFSGESVPALTLGVIRPPVNMPLENRLRLAAMRGSQSWLQPPFRRPLCCERSLGFATTRSVSVVERRSASKTRRKCKT